MTGFTRVHPYLRLCAAGILWIGAAGLPLANADEKASTPSVKAALTDGAGNSASLVSARREIAAQYAQLGQAFKNRDAHAYVALMTADFVAQLPAGQTAGIRDIEARLKDQFEHLQSVRSMSYAIDKLSLEGSTAIVTATGTSSVRVADPAGSVHTVDQVNTVVNTWLRTPLGWRMRKASPVRLKISVDGKLTQDVFLSVPSPAETRTLIKESLLAWNRAVQTGEFSFFHAGLAAPFREKFSADKLRETFQAFADKKINIAPIKELNPVMEHLPTIDESGLLTVSGHYPTQPSKVSFKLEYLHEGDVWRLAGLDVNVR